MNNLRRHLYAGGAWLRRRLPMLRDDRGEGPVPTAIIWIGAAILALAVLAFFFVYTGGFIDQAPSELPQPGFGNG